jgi:hypothetical protein
MSGDSGRAGHSKPARATGPTWGERRRSGSCWALPDRNSFDYCSASTKGLGGVRGARVCGSLAAALPLSTKQKKQKIKKRGRARRFGLAPFWLGAAFAVRLKLGPSLMFSHSRSNNSSAFTTTLFPTLIKSVRPFQQRLRSARRDAFGLRPVLPAVIPEHSTSYPVAPCSTHWDMHPAEDSTHESEFPRRRVCPERAQNQ